MCQRIVKATKGLREKLKRRKEAISCSGGTLNLEGLNEDVEALLNHRENVRWKSPKKKTSQTACITPSRTNHCSSVVFPLKFETFCLP